METGRDFIKSGSIITATTLLSGNKLFALNTNDFTSRWPPLSERKFTSEAVEAAICIYHK